MANKNIKEVEGGEVTALSDADGIEIDTSSLSVWIQFLNLVKEAFKRINSLTQDNSPDRSADFVGTYDASAGSGKKVALQDVGAYTLTAYFTLQLNPLDATTYVFSPYPSIGLVSNAAAHKIRVPRGGVVRKVYIEGICTVGSNETSTISFRLNDTTDTTITSVAIFNASPFSFSKTDLAIDVATGDYFTIKWVTPTWVTTNPTSVSMMATIWIA